MDESTTHSTSSNENTRSPKTVPVRFYGKAGEFFAIWIVNLLLTFVTLGIYSAWAKVRTYRYFYSNTEVDDHRFSYLAEPLQILKGRIIGVILFGVYFLASSLSPILASVIMLILVIATPFLICASIRFKMRMTAYRNIRFNFTGRYGGAFVTFILLPIAALFTLYLAMPWVLKKMDEFLLTHTTFGNKPVSTEISTGEYYIAAICTALIGAGLFFIGAIAAGGSLTMLTNPEAALEGMSFTLVILMALYVLVFTLASSFYTARIRNHIFNSSRIDDVAGFISNLSFGRLALLRITNFLALVCSFGFAMPWVKIRTAKLFADATQVTILEGANNVMVDASQSASAVGEEVADVFDIDIALG
jgi:uncharacterized membrane protein YjgN (DUF898 family)